MMGAIGIPACLPTCHRVESFDERRNAAFLKGLHGLNNELSTANDWRVLRNQIKPRRSAVSPAMRVVSHVRRAADHDPAIEKRLGQSVHCFGSEVEWINMSRHVRCLSLPDEMAAPFEPVPVGQLADSIAGRWIYRLDVADGCRRKLFDVTTGRLQGSRRAEHGTDPHGRDTALRRGLIWLRRTRQSFAVESSLFRP